MDWTRLKVWGDVASFNAATYGAKPAFLSSNGAVTFTEVNFRVNQLNNALATLGLVAGERVAILSRNRTEYFEVFGVAKSGMIAVPLNWRLSARELLHALKDSRPSVIFAEPEFQTTIDPLRAELPGVGHYIGLGPALAPGWTPYETLLAGASHDEPRADVQPDDTLCLIYSSGTTGAPKSAVLTHRRALNTSRAIVQDMLALTPEDVALSVMPWFHVGGMWYHLFPSFAAGETTVVLPEFDPSAVLSAIQGYGVTQVHLVPTMISILLNHPGVETMDLAHLRTIYYAASPIPLSVLKRALQVFKGCGFVQSYGLTEMGGVTALMPQDHVTATSDPSMEGLLLSGGRPMPGVIVAIRDSTGAPLAHGQIGDITVQSDRLMSSYWENEAMTAKTVVDGWLYTGDVGYLDQDGYMYLVDRKHDMIVTGGENVYPREVEDILYEDPNVAEVAVFAIPDPKWVERVAAAVVLKPGRSTSEAELRRLAALRLAPYKCPKTVLFLERLPKNATGKILKKELRREYASLLNSETDS